MQLKISAMKKDIFKCVIEKFLSFSFGLHERILFSIVVCSF